MAIGGTIRLASRDLWGGEPTSGCDLRLSTFDRIVAVLADREWHTLGELTAVTPYAEWWLEELRHDHLEILKNRERVKLLTVGPIR